MHRMHEIMTGLIKPDIVFFGEDLPARFHNQSLLDFAECDLLIVMGTSLQVRAPVGTLYKGELGGVPLIASSSL